MSFTIRYKQSVVNDDILFIEHAMRLRIQAAICDKLTVDPLRFGKPLRFDWAGARALRVRDYRIIYDIDRPNETVTILRIGHRRDIYEQ